MGHYSPAQEFEPLSLRLKRYRAPFGPENYLAGPRIGDFLVSEIAKIEPPNPIRALHNGALHSRDFVSQANGALHSRPSVRFGDATVIFFKPGRFGRRQ
jgi:hypothetical protein